MDIHLYASSSVLKVYITQLSTRRDNNISIYKSRVHNVKNNINKTFGKKKKLKKLELYNDCYEIK